MLGSSALGHLIESVAWLVKPCARGLAILWQIIGFVISKLHYCCVNCIFVLDKKNTAWLRDTVRQTSLGTSAWPYRVTTQYSYFIYTYTYIYIYIYQMEHQEWPPMIPRTIPNDSDFYLGHSVSIIEVQGRIVFALTAIWTFVIEWLKDHFYI